MSDNKPVATTSEAPSPYECNICLETAAEPVVTYCGHLYCWPCLYRWLRSHANCPVCKASVTRETVIPLYGRGGERADPRGSATDGSGESEATASQGAPVYREEESVPNRPAGQRVEVPAAQGIAGGVGMPEGWASGFGQGTFTAGFGFFPSLFGLQFQTFGLDRPRPRGQPMTPEEQHRMFLSRLMLVLGFFVLLMLLFF